MKVFVLDGGSMDECKFTVKELGGRIDASLVLIEQEKVCMLRAGGEEEENSGTCTILGH
jgi:hypothetical protein